MRFARLVFFRQQHAAWPRFGSEHVQQARLSTHDNDALGALQGSNDKAATLCQRHLFEGSGPDYCAACARHSERRATSRASSI